MTMEEVKRMFEGYEEYVEIHESAEHIHIIVIDCIGFDESWNEIINDVPDIVYERAAACELGGAIVDLTSMDI